MKQPPVVSTIQTAAVISREKLGGGGRHYGVHFPDGLVVDFHPTGVRFTNIHQFLAELPYKTERLIPQSEVRGARWRAQTAKGRVPPYHLLEFNCEHFANYVAGMVKPESTQINALAFLAIVGLVFAALSN